MATDPGNVGETVSHESVFEELVRKSVGGPRSAVAIGAYDGVGVSEGPDDETATAIALSYGSLEPGGPQLCGVQHRDERVRMLRQSAGPSPVITEGS